MMVVFIITLILLGFWTIITTLVHKTVIAIIGTIVVLWFVGMVAR